jgi:hypothetical protein
MKRNTKGQIWTLDLIVALVLFIIGALFFYQYGSSVRENNSNEINELSLQTERISNNLMGSGEPSEWNNASVISIGLSDGNSRLVLNKLRELNQIPYPDTKHLLSTNRDYQITFRNGNNTLLSFNNQTFWGKNISLDSPKQMLKSKRLLFYNHSILSMEILVW